MQWAGGRQWDIVGWLLGCHGRGIKLLLAEEIAYRLRIVVPETYINTQVHLIA